VTDRRKFVVAIARGVPLDVEQIASPSILGTQTGLNSEMTQQYQLLKDIFTNARRTKR
jgi:hypothetical protein